MSLERPPGPRPDRRRRDLPWWHPRRLRGRRMRDHHAEAAGSVYFVERISGRAFAMAALVLLLTIADGVFTVILLDHGCVEANPLMRWLLERSVWLFFVGKYILTATFLPFALVLYRYRVFGTRVRVGQLLPVIAGLYLLLLAYQFGLWQASRTHGHWHKSARGRPEVNQGPVPGRASRDRWAGGAAA